MFKRILGHLAAVATISSLLSSLVPTAGAQCVMLYNSDGNLGTSFGSSLAVVGDRVVVGAPAASVDSAIQETGAVYVMKIQGNSWLQEAKLLPPTLIPSHEMSLSSFDGVRILASAPYADVNGNESGVAYIYVLENNSWTLETTLLPSDVEEGDHFRGAAIQGEWAIAIAPYRAVYVFHFEDNSWVQQTKLTLPGNNILDCAYDADTLLISAAAGIDQEMNPPSVHVFVRQGTDWVEEAVLTAPIGQLNSYFGGGLAVSGDVAVVMAPGEYSSLSPDNRTGGIYVFERQGAIWSLTNRLDGHGDGLAVQANRFVLGDAWNPLLGHGQVNVYTKVNSNWVQTSQRTAPFVTMASSFGASVALTADRIVVGAPSLREVFTFPTATSPNDCNGNCAADFLEIAAGTESDCNSNGMIDSCEVGACPPGQPSCSDCNNNGVLDGCDRSACDGSAFCSDCDGNGVMDGCDIANAVGNVLHYDCNANSRPDGCDLQDGTEQDENANSIPDSCECPLYTPGIQLFGSPSYSAYSVSASSTRIAASRDGYVRVFRLNAGNWAQEADLGSQGYDEAVVSIDGDNLLVGDAEDSPLGLTDAGSVDVFHFDGADWVLEANLTASDAIGGEKLGASVALVGNLSIAGAPETTHSGLNQAGVVKVFRKDASVWVEEATLTASDAQEGDHFGNSVSFDGTRLIVGAYFSDVPTGTGAAYVFRRVGLGWVEEAKLTTIGITNVFGRSVSINGNLAVVGSAHNVAYSFHSDGANWVEEWPPLQPSFSPDNFGYSVAMSGDLLLIGSPVPSPSGSAFLFKRLSSNWSELTTFLPPSPPLLTDFGYSVALHGDIAAISTIYSRVSVFHAAPPDCDANGDNDLCQIAVALAQDCNSNSVLDGCDIESGLSLDATEDGIPDECQCSPVDCTDGNACTLDVCQTPGLLCDHEPLPSLRFGDLNNDTFVNLDDILCMLAGFGGRFSSSCPRERLDIVPCPANDGVITVDDILGVLLAFGGGVSAGCSADVCAP